MMDRLIMVLATGLYSGYLPKAPGTWGSVVGLVLYYFLHAVALPTYLIIVGVLLVVGFFVAGSAEKILDRKDPGCVVIDEIVGLLITLAAAPPFPLAWLLGFVLFRFFDIIKPFPVRWVDERIQGGVGIMLDDVVAGLFGFLVLQGILWVW
jgi:phosphatidylglycerophosphatase A